MSVRAIVTVTKAGQLVLATQQEGRSANRYFILHACGMNEPMTPNDVAFGDVTLASVLRSWFDEWNKEREQHRRRALGKNFGPWRAKFDELAKANLTAENRRSVEELEQAAFDWLVAEGKATKEDADRARSGCRFSNRLITRRVLTVDGWLGAIKLYYDGRLNQVVVLLTGGVHSTLDARVDDAPLWGVRATLDPTTGKVIEIDRRDETFFSKKNRQHRPFHPQLIRREFKPGTVFPVVLLAPQMAWPCLVHVGAEGNPGAFNLNEAFPDNSLAAAGDPAKDELDATVGGERLHFLRKAVGGKYVVEVGGALASHPDGTGVRRLLRVWTVSGQFWHAQHIGLQDEGGETIGEVEAPEADDQSTAATPDAPPMTA